MCTINWQLLLEYLRVVLSWPPIVLLIAILFLSKFRGAIDDFLQRLVEGTIFGQKFKAVPPPQQISPDGVTEDRLTRAAEAAPIQNDHNKEPAEVQLPPELMGDPQALTAIEYVRANPAQTVIEYKRVLFAYNSERLFNRIYGTQISLLEFLASRPDTPTSMTQIAQFHTEYQQKSGNTEYQLRDYVNFLVSFGVVSFSGQENAYVYSITQHGSEFLSYIKSNYPANWNQRAF